MSKIDVSDEDRVVVKGPNVWAVIFNKKEYGYFNSYMGALEYLEVLKRGERERERSTDSDKAETVS